MEKPQNYDNTLEFDADYADFEEKHRSELLKLAVDAINPDTMRMDRDQALTLAGAMKNCGFTQEDYAAVLAKSSQDKGTFSKQWNKFRGKGKHGEATEGTIYNYALQSGWKWPSPKDFNASISKTTPKKKQPETIKKAADDFKLHCIIDSVCYADKPEGGEITDIRKREQLNTPYPEGVTIKEFVDAITTGHTFYPCIYKKVQEKDEKGELISKYYAMGQQLFIVDIDNDKQALDADGKPIKGEKVPIDKPLTIEDAKEICRKNEIEPFFIYETFSSKKHREDAEKPFTKFRLCFATSEPLSVRKYGEFGLSKVREWLISLFGDAADHSTTDPARLIFGTDEKAALISNQVLKADRVIEKAFAPQPEEEQTEEEPQAVAEMLDGFIPGITNNADSSRPIHTGFNGLDTMLDGGLYTGLYFLGAISSLGKTSFLLQVMDNIAKSGHDVLIFSLEMAKTELMAKSISRLTFELSQDSDKAKTTRGILCGTKYADYDIEERLLIDNAVTEYRPTAEHLFIFEGVGDIGVKEIAAKVKTHIDKTGNKRPVVFIDYLQILAPYDVKASDKQNTDKAVVELKRLSRDYNLPIIAVSSFNRDNYTAPVNTASFKESGAIEYSADTLIGLQYKGMDYKKFGNGKVESKEQRTVRVSQLIEENERKSRAGDPVTVQLKILKNRNGVKGKLYFDFYSKFNMFAEHSQTDQDVEVYNWDDTIPEEWN